MSELEKIETLLKQTMGLNAKSVGFATIERAVRERCAAQGAADIAAYWNRVKNSPAELQELIDSVIVPETWFFRDAEAFNALARLAISQMIGSARRLRMLSLPCSTGEEPYSMAMALLDAGVPPARFQIDAVDICTRSIAAAQRGIYGTNSFRGKDLAFRNRHFASVANRYTVSDAVRSTVRFRHGNLFDPALLPNECGYDFIFCRNVLIYFDNAQQAKAIKVLDRLLHDSGVLFAGPSEGAVLIRENMVSAGMPLTFAFRKSATAPAYRASSASPLNRPATPGASWLPKPWRPSARPADDPAQDKTAPAQPRSDAAPPTPSTTQGPTPDDDPITLAAQLADQGQLRQAAELCQRHMQAHGPSAAAFHLLGLISDAAGQHLEAREHYRKALYLDPQHTEALAHLAALLDMHGDTAGAQRLNDRARRTSSKRLD